MVTSRENPRFAGKVAFVTGAGSGIGRAAARLFARDHASVVVATHTVGPRDADPQVRR